MNDNAYNSAQSPTQLREYLRENSLGCSFISIRKYAFAMSLPSVYSLHKLKFHGGIDNFYGPNDVIF